MREFKDSNGNVWRIDLTIGDVVRVRRASEKRFDLFEMGGDSPDGLAMRLWSDPGEFWELLWHLVEPQFAAKGIVVPEGKSAAEVFGELLAADCLVAAQRLFFEEWADFFQKLQRPTNSMAIHRMVKYCAKALELVQTQLNEIDLAEIDRAAEAKIGEALTTSLTNLRHALESKTPAHSRSAAFASASKRSRGKRA